MSYKGCEKRDVDYTRKSRPCGFRSNLELRVLSSKKYLDLINHSLKIPSGYL